MLIAAGTATFEQLGKAIDDAFARRDHNRPHESTLADGTVIIPVRWWDGEEPEGSLDGAKAMLGRPRPGEQFAYTFDLGDNCRAGAGATSPTSTAAAGTAKMAAAPRPRPPTGWLTSRQSCPDGDPGGHGQPRHLLTAARPATAT